MNLDIVILLAAGPIQSDNTFADFQDGMYVGGQVRMQAAAQLVSMYPKTQLILVGGYNKADEGHQSTSNKVNDMASFIKRTSPHANLKLVYSLPCTHHNFVAVLNDWTVNGIHPSHVGILSNGYHLERAAIFAQEAATAGSNFASVQFELLPAETILGITPKNIASGHHAEYDARLASEQRGIDQLKNGDYVDSCLTKNLASLRPVIDKYSAQLLTTAELLSLK